MTHPIAPSGLLRRVDILARYGLNHRTIRRWERSGLAIAKRGPGRTQWYRAEDVEARLIEEASAPSSAPSPPQATPQPPRAELDAARFDVVSAEGQLTARAFELFEAGSTMRQVVIALRRPVREILELRRSYEGLEQLDALRDAVAAELASAGIPFPASSAAVLRHVRRYTALLRQAEQAALIRAGEPPSPAAEGGGGEETL
ncbi:MAG: hypothetical protein R3B72_51890 [Polyangiaceae bacterium]